MFSRNYLGGVIAYAFPIGLFALCRFSKAKIDFLAQLFLILNC